MSSVRVNQRLDTPYNPDGTPGTVSTGAPGIPGRAPLPEEIYAAVTQYIATNPITTPTVSSSTSESNRFGSGATGHPGAYVDIGTEGTLNGYVKSGGTPQVVNLYLQAQNGTVVSSSPMETSSTLSVRDQLTLHDNKINLREPGDTFFLGYVAGTGTQLYGDTGGVGNASNYVTWDSTKFAFSGSVTVAGTSTLATPVAGTDTALTTAATDVKAVTVRTTAAGRRGFVITELPANCVIGGQVDVLGVLATLWAQVKTLTP